MTGGGGVITLSILGTLSLGAFAVLRWRKHGRLLGLGGNESSRKSSKPDKTPPTPARPTNNAVFLQMGEARILSHIAQYLKPNIEDLMNFSLSCRACLQDVGGSFQLWREVYCACEPLMLKELKKKLLSDKYCEHKEMTGPETLKYSVWVRTCALLKKKAKLVLVLLGKDPIVVRKLGHPESLAEKIHLSINYQLDSYLDDDEKRFAAEFPQIFQELNFGDVVITQDYRGAGCWLVIPDPQDKSTLILKKNRYDTAGYGILSKMVGPPTFPLFYYCDLKMGDQFDKQTLMQRQVYWFTYSQLKDGSLFSWAEQTIVDEV